MLGRRVTGRGSQAQILRYGRQTRVLHLRLNSRT